MHWLALASWQNLLSTFNYPNKPTNQTTLKAIVHGPLAHPHLQMLLHVSPALLACFKALLGALPLCCLQSLQLEVLGQAGLCESCMAARKLPGSLLRGLSTPTRCL